MRVQGSKHVAQLCACQIVTAQMSSISGVVFGPQSNVPQHASLWDAAGCSMASVAPDAAAAPCNQQCNFEPSSIQVLGAYTWLHAAKRLHCCWNGACVAAGFQSYVRSKLWRMDASGAVLGSGGARKRPPPRQLVGALCSAAARYQLCACSSYRACISPVPVPFAAVAARYRRRLLAQAHSCLRLAAPVCT